METKNTQTVARQAATPTAPQGGASSEVPASAQTGKEGRRADEITLRVPNPLLERQKAPTPPQAAPPQADPMSPHSLPTAKLKVSSLVWNEYNSMPMTPPPATLGQPQPPLNNPGSLEPPKKRRGLIIVLAAGIICAGVIAGALLPRSKPEAPVNVLPEQESKGPTGTPEKSLDLPKSPAPAGGPPSPSPLAKRHVSVIVEPAEATLTLDGTVAPGHVIALDLVQDGKPHLVQASARGYLPFKKSFTLEGDVNLHISLKKAASPAPAFSPHPKTQPSEPVAKPPEVEPSVQPKVEPVEDFGMDLNRPANRRQIKKMDEKDPYSP